MAGAEILVREGVLSDLDRMVDIWRQLVREHENRDRLYWRLKPDAEDLYREFRREMFSNPSSLHLVAEVSGVVAGYVYASPFDLPPMYALERSGRLREVAVDEHFRGRGVGKALVAAALAELGRRGFKVAELTVDVDNEAAIGLYEKSGFHKRQIQMVAGLKKVE